MLKDRQRLSAEARADLDALISAGRHQTHRPRLALPRALRDILDRKQINVVAAMLRQWCTNVMRSKRCYGASGEDKASSSLDTTDGVPHAAAK